MKELSFVADLLKKGSKPQQITVSCFGWLLRQFGVDIQNQWTCWHLRDREKEFKKKQKQTNKTKTSLIGIYSFDYNKTKRKIKENIVERIEKDVRGEKRSERNEPNKI